MLSEINFHQEDLSFELEDPVLKTQWILDTILSEQKNCGIINYIFCSDDYLHKINVEYLSHDTLTDIITFDYSEESSLSGDIYISIDRVQENSKDFKKEFLNELGRVMIHGILHLCGYHDKKPEDQAIMRDKEDFYLNLHPSK